MLRQRERSACVRPEKQASPQERKGGKRPFSQEKAYRAASMEGFHSMKRFTLKMAPPTPYPAIDFTEDRSSK